MTRWLWWLQYSERMHDLNGIWEISTASQRLEYAISIAALCRELEALGYLTHFGHFRQQHMQDKGTVWGVGLISFLPKEYDGKRYGVVTLDDPLEIPEQDRSKL